MTARPVPADLEEALAAAPAARERFWSLTPEQVDEWVDWVEGARLPRKRRRRVGETVRRLNGTPVAAAETTSVATNGGRPALPPREPVGLWLLAIALLLLIGALIYFLAVRNDNSPAPAGARVTVPKVVGLRAPAARLRLGQEKLRAVGVKVSAAQPSGVVVGQRPSAGASVPQRTLVTIVVSKGPAAVKLPSIVGLDAAEAAKRLQALQLTTTVKQVVSTKTPGTVIRQTPAAGTLAKAGTPVVLVVSKRNVAVPAVSGQTVQQATAALRQAGLTATIVEVPSSQPKGTVVAQNPAAAAKAQAGSSVRLNVSKGAASAPAQTTTQTTAQPTTTQGAASSLPPAPPQGSGNDYRGLQLARAVQQIADGSQQAIVLYVASAKPAGVVVSNGTAGSKMRLAVSAGPHPGAATDVPDVSGEDGAQAQNDLESAGFTVVTVQWPVSDASVDGTVVLETPAGGRRAPLGAAIVLYLGNVSGG